MYNPAQLNCYTYASKKAPFCRVVLAMDNWAPMCRNSGSISSVDLMAKIPSQGQGSCSNGGPAHSQGTRTWCLVVDTDMEQPGCHGLTGLTGKKSESRWPIVMWVEDDSTEDTSWSLLECPGAFRLETKILGENAGRPNLPSTYFVLKSLLTSKTNADLLLLTGMV